MLITEKDEQTVEFQRSSNEGERSRSTKHHEQARHPILTSQGAREAKTTGMRHATAPGSPLKANGVRRRGQMRTPSNGGRKEGEMRTWIWIGTRPAGAERAVGRHSEEKTWPALGNGLWERARGVYRLRPVPVNRRIFFLRLTYFKFYLKIIYPNKYLHIY